MNIPIIIEDCEKKRKEQENFENCLRKAVKGIAQKLQPYFCNSLITSRSNVGFCFFIYQQQKEIRLFFFPYTNYKEIFQVDYLLGSRRTLSCNISREVSEPIMDKIIEDLQIFAREHDIREIEIKIP